MDYDAFGAVTQDTNPGFQPFGFAGGLHDRDTGLVRFGARDYDPAIGRWSAKDPRGMEADGENLFVYALGDATNRLDVDGLTSLVVRPSAFPRPNPLTDAIRAGLKNPPPKPKTTLERVIDQAVRDGLIKRPPRPDELKPYLERPSTPEQPRPPLDGWEELFKWFEDTFGQSGAIPELTPEQELNCIMFPELCEYFLECDRVY
jgi:RHS repeat-associated protein